VEPRGRGASLKRYERTLNDGLFDQLPTAKPALAAGLQGEDELADAFGAVYREYVVGYFRTLLQ
jgi:hypothetical protein